MKKVILTCITLSALLIAGCGQVNLTPTATGANVPDSGSSDKLTVAGQSMDAAKAVDCQNRLSQIRTQLENLKMTGDPAPATINELMSSGTDYGKCPVSGAAYEYNPGGYTVSCPTHKLK